MKIVGNYGIFANIAVKKAIWFCGGDELVCVADAIIRQNQETIDIVQARVTRELMHIEASST